MKLKAGTFAALLTDDQLSKLTELKQQLAQHQEQPKQARIPPSQANKTAKERNNFAGKTKTNASHSKSKPDWIHQFISEVITDLSVPSTSKQTPKAPVNTHSNKPIKQVSQNKQPVQTKPKESTDLDIVNELKNDAHLAVRRPAHKSHMSKVDRVVAIAEVMHPSHKPQEFDLLIKAAFEKHAANPVDRNHGKLRLNVKRGSILQSSGYCSVCLTTLAPLTRYADSNYGPVILCSVCKKNAFEHSFGHADAMPLKVDHAHAHKGKW